MTRCPADPLPGQVGADAVIAPGQADHPGGVDRALYVDAVACFVHLGQRSSAGGGGTGP